jgi:hypothetical protein
MGRTCCIHGREEDRNAYRVLAGNPEEMELFGRPKPTKDDNIEMDLKETGWNVMNWIHVAQERDKWLALMHMVMNLWIH